MKISTTLNHIKKIESSIHAIFSVATISLKTHAEILDSLTKMKEKTYARVWEKLPSWAQNRIFDLEKLKFDEIQNHFTVWGYKFDKIDSPVLGCELNSSQLRKAVNMKGHYYWLEQINQNKIYNLNSIKRERGEKIVTRKYKVTNKIFC